MGKGKKITVDGTVLRVIEHNEEDFISLTDIVNKFDDSQLLYRWMRNRNTLEFLGVWESLNNTTFKPTEFERFKSDAGLNTFSMSPKKWIDATNAVGIVSKSGRHGGGTYAHKDIALEFCSWLSPVFRLYVFKEFQRLKEEEASVKSLEWNVHRIMAKANFRILTEAVREHLIPPRIQNTRFEANYFASEADLLNKAMFGMTAKEWRQSSPEQKGNIRDNITKEQLLVLSNLQSLNAKLIKWGSDQQQRLQILNESAIEEMEILVAGASLKALPKDKGGNAKLNKGT